MRLAVVPLVVLLATVFAFAEVSEEKPTIEPLVRAVDLNVGQEQTVELCDGSKATVKLLDLVEHRDALRNAVRRAVVTVVVNGEKAVLTSATYHLPRVVGGVQIDCPVTKGHVQPDLNPWSLDADVRLRLWPKDSPWIRPGTFQYPVNQRWFASYTLMANQIGDGEEPAKKTIYYHYGLDFGGAERMVDALSATDGVVVASGEKLLGSGPYPDMLKPRYDVVYIRDGRGWYYRYSHLDSIDPAMTLGARVKMGQKVGVLGKEGASGGWSHLHFDVNRPQPSGRYGIDDGYAFIWQAYQQQHPTPLVAVARPHQIAWAGDPVTLDASRSYSVLGPDAMRFEWTLTDGTTATGPTVTRVYDKPGDYSEIVKVTDREGRVDYDFAVVGVMDRNAPAQARPGLHAAYWPTFGIQPGDEVTFKVRAFGLRPDEGRDTWDFGDGSPAATTQSPGNADPHAKDGYAATTHRYAKPGHYLVTVRRANDRGETGVDHLQVRVGLESEARGGDLGRMKADRVLFLGNSICLVPRGPDGRDNWGLSASAPEKDYVHLLARSIEARTGTKLRLVATNPAIKNPDGSIVTGDANIVNIADIFERQYATYTAARLRWQIDWKPDVVVLQFGENIPPQTFDAAVFEKSLKQLVADFQTSGNPHIFVTGYILGSNAVVDDIKRQVCAEDKTHRVFVDLSRVWPDAATHGELGHPNDKGMAMIADLLFRAMAAHSDAEPPQ